MTRKDAAVSPVVGVMLMLAVTIMIAAIVSATAGSFSNTEKKAPSAILDVSIYAAKVYGNFSAPTMTIRHVSGNVLQTKDLQIVTYYTVPGSGNISRGSLIGEKTVDVEGSSGTEQYGALFISDERHGSPDRWFGNASATFGPGDILVTPAQYCVKEKTDAVNAELHRNPGMEQLFPNVQFIRSSATDANEFSAGGVVTVKIIHTPSGQIIFDKDVVIS
ncbi:type IV pilin N-terminal domain-containing protein [Methanoregula sp.]|uniref:type IV pilin N-terminal domain-containing protein n=1 Tax=Methanoregula sp. TaxID=2052170 RepID=UPI0035652784